ncbi:MauE/DoxX family redox-associated membrane protein [Prosthecobacter vanneervenii]|uniref:Putative membrane protein YphA (DoxX/SURF4 family) n=1 Tax=Prosthecobacter vanneervenii TaxID=48466 RepID=A0A7W7YEG0_9BACT|nr:MauE/DoxX family redox-associated membrane protein [Prosthecobacter vanneervenii]MBB5034705.1 putative membrane protein YphA (DoxX/SURF4 family) [Prosthecobacter vanneervenii]
MLRLLLHFFFGGVFVYAGILKAADPMSFLDDIRSFDLLGDPWAAWLAMGLPWLEILAGLAVMSGVLRSGGLLVLNGSLLVFLAAISISWGRGIDIRCGCFGHADATSNYRDLILRDILLLIGGLVLVWHGKPRSKA